MLIHNCQENLIVQLFLELNQVLKYLTSTLLLSLILTIGYVFIQESKVLKYKSILIANDAYLEGQRVYYHDFDSNGVSEHILMGYNSQSGYPFVLFSDIEKNVICQWDLLDNWIDRSDAMFGDCDGNGQDEMYVFTKVLDTIFINGFEPMSQKTIAFKRKIDVAGRYNDENDFDIYIGGVEDIDNDGYKEVVFFINSGYSIYPRNVYIYYPIKDALSISPSSGAQVPSPLLIKDINFDKKKEILLNTYAPGNIEDKSIPYRDSSSWLMVLNYKNDFIFHPIEFKGYTASVKVVPFLHEKDMNLLILSRSEDSTKRFIHKLILYDIEGNIITEKQLESPVRTSFNGFSFMEDNKYTEPFILDADGNILKIDDKLNLKEYITLPVKGSSLLNIPFVPINTYLLLSGNKESIYLFDNSFKHPLLFDVPNEGGKITFSVAHSSVSQTDYSFQIGKFWYLYSIEKNLLFQLRYLHYLIFFIVIFLIIFVIKKVQRDQLKKRHENEREVLELQMKALKNQVDPHFTLNILNSIGSLYYNNQEQADYYFGKYAKLIRQTLTSTDKAGVTLSEEIKFVEHYLILERFRYKGLFDFKIEVDPSIEHVVIPRMLIHTFAENAIKHGLKPRMTGGEFLIHAFKNKGNIEIHLKDNGIGRQAASFSNKESTGKGYAIIDSMLKIYNHLYSEKIYYEVLDLFDDEGIPNGTEVIIKIHGS